MVAKVVMFVFTSVIITLDISSANKPHIVFIIADDLGWNDVSFHGSDQILTPNIDSLAYSGVAFGRYYTHAACTPSRSALLTGKFAHNLGMQGWPLTMSEDRAIPAKVNLLPQYLKAAGYSTHLVGKWHVGLARKEHLPTFRGFDSHFGHRGGYIDYYEHNIVEQVEGVPTTGFALYRNLTAAWDVEGYITDVYTKQATSIIARHDTSNPLFLMLAHNAPHSANSGAWLQAPPDEVRRMRHVESAERRIYAAMVKKLDDSVGEVVQALHNKGILGNTKIIFVSDNGGMTSGNNNNYASNYPLRGIKMTPFEGGLRVVGLLWSNDFNNTSHYWDGFMHAADWLPTLLRIAGEPISSDIDGINQWEKIKHNLPSDRVEMYEIDDYTGYASMIYGNYKLVTGTVTVAYSDYQGGNLRGIIEDPPSYVEAIQNSAVYKVFKTIGLTFDTESTRRNYIVKCENTSLPICYSNKERFCLYNIIEDPCETTDLSQSRPDLVTTIKTLLEVEINRRIPRTVPVSRDPRAAPRLFNYTWAPWIE